MSNTAEKLLCAILECGTDDIEPLFKELAGSGYLFDALKVLKDNGVAINAGNLWAECMQVAADDIFGESTPVEIYFNYLDSHVAMKRTIAEKLENLHKKMSVFEKSTGFEIELFD